MPSPSARLSPRLVSLIGLSCLAVQMAGCGVPPADVALLPDGGSERIPVGTVDAGNPPGDGGAPENGSLQIVSPANGLLTDATQLSVQVVSSGTAPEQVELLVDGLAMGSLTQAPYVFMLNLSPVADGTHALVARASDGQSSWLSPPIAITLDRAAPTVVSQSPPPGATNVTLGTPIQVTFSEAMNVQRTTTGLALSVDGHPASATVSVSPDGRTFTVTPSSPTTGSLQVDLSQATDLAGNPVHVAEAWSWNVPVYLSGAAPDLGINRVAVSADGAHVFTFVAGSGNWVAQELNADGKSWTNLNYVAPLPNEVVSSVALAAGRSGDLWVLEQASRIGPNNFGSNSAYYTYFIHHWTGSVWKVVPALPATVPNVESENDIMLTVGVAASDDGATFALQVPGTGPAIWNPSVGWKYGPHPILDLYPAQSLQLAFQSDGSLLSTKNSSFGYHAVDRFDAGTYALHPNLAVLSPGLNLTPLFARAAGNLYASWLDSAQSQFSVSDFNGTGWTSTESPLNTGLALQQPSFYGTASSDLVVGALTSDDQMLVSRLQNGNWATQPTVACQSHDCVVVPTAGGAPLIIDWGHASYVRNE